jgi:hypothetical protein
METLRGVRGVMAVASVVSFSSASASGARHVPKLGSGQPVAPQEFSSFFDARYQIGSEWGKVAISPQDLQDVPGLASES